MGRKGTLLAGVFLAPLMAAAVSGSAHAGDVKITPSIEFGETFTDNVALTATNKQYDWVQSISPRIQVTDTGNRVNLNVTGGGDYLYFDRLNKDDLRPFLQGTATIEAIPDNLTINAQADIQESLIDPSGGFSVSPYNDTLNRQTVQVYTVGPTLTHHFGPVADVQIDYLFSYVSADSTQAVVGTPAPQNFLNATYIHDVTADINSGDDFTKFTWNLHANYNYSHASAGNVVGATPSNFDQLNSLATGNYILNSRLALIADVGYDHIGNNSGLVGTGFVSGGIVFHGGFQLNSPKSQIRVLVGQRYGGLNVDAQATYNFTSRTTLTATYTEEITTSAQRLAQLLGIAAGTSFATTFNLDPRFTLSDEAYFVRTAGATLTVRRGKNDFSVYGFAERRHYRLAPLKDWTYGGTVTYARQLNRKWTFDSLLLYTYQDFNNFVNRRDNIYAAQIGLTDQFARSIKASLTYRLSYRNSSNPTFDVQENAVTLLLTTVF